MTLQEKDLNSVGIQVLNKGADQLYHLRDQVYHQVYYQVRNQVRNQVSDQVCDQVSDQVYLKINKL